MNFNQKYVNIVLSILSTLLYIYIYMLLYIFYIYFLPHYAVQLTLMLLPYHNAVNLFSCFFFHITQFNLRSLSFLPPYTANFILMLLPHYAVHSNLMQPTSLKSNNPPHDSVLIHTQLFPYCDRLSLTSLQNNTKNYIFTYFNVYVFRLQAVRQIF
jgi:hypothetical protein